MVGEIFDNVGVEAQDAKFMSTHHPREELHNENFMFKREALIVTAEVIVQLLSKCLWVIEELQCREVWCRRCIFVVLFLKEILGGGVNLGKS